MAEIRPTAPATHSQPSRKGKKAWRKNVDLTEVQQGLDNVREEIIQGGVVAEKDSSELFATDLTGDSTVGQPSRGKKLLKVDEILAQRSAVPGLDGRKRKVKEDIALLSQKRQRNGKFVPHKQLEHLQAVADNATGGAALEDGTPSHDPWAPQVKVQDPRFSFLDEKQATREPKTLKQAPKSLAVSGKRIPSVPKPDAGKSYNPLVGDWTALLEREGAEAVEAEKRRIAAEVADAKMEAIALDEAAKVEAAERADEATDYDSAWESEWDGFQSENEIIHTQKMKSRKTPSERNKAKARKEREAREKAERKEKQRAVEERRIKQIAKEVSAKDQARRAHTMALQQRNPNDDDSSASEAEAVVLRRQRFGKLAVPQAPLEVVLPEELEDSLRRLKPEGDLMEERYRNMLINGKLEVRKKIWQRKQPKRTTSEKWSYKDWKLR